MEQNAALSAFLEKLEDTALETLDGAALAPHASRLSYLAVLAKRSSQTDPWPSLEALPPVLTARILSFLPANHLARAARLSSTFRCTHVPTAIALRVARLQLNNCHSPLDLLLETQSESAARAADSVRPTGYCGTDGVCLASAKASPSPPPPIHGEYCFSLSLVNLLYPKSRDGLGAGFNVPDFSAGAAHRHVFYTCSGVVPMFPLTEDACAVLKDPRAGMARSVRESKSMLEETGSAAVVCAYVSVTQAATGKTSGLLQVARFGDEDAEDVDVTHLMPKHHVSEHDECTHGGYMAGIFRYYLRLDADGIDLLEGPPGNSEGGEEDAADEEGEAADEGSVGDEGAAGEVGATGDESASSTAGVQTTAKISLTMWSEVHSAGPWGGECSGYQEYGVGNLNDTLVCLLRGILFDAD